MLLREAVVGQRLLDAALHEIGSLGEAMVAQLGGHLPSLLACRLHILGGVDRLQHRCDLAHLRSRHVGEDVAVEVHRAALPGRVGEELRRALGQADACVRDDQPYALQPALLQMLQETRPARLVLLRAFDDAENLAKTLAIHGNSDE